MPSLLLLSFLFITSYTHAQEILTFDHTQNKIILLQSSPEIIPFLIELEKKTSVNINCSTDLIGNIIITEDSFSLPEVIRILENQFSTIQGFDHNGDLASISVLPIAGSKVREALVPVSDMLKTQISTNRKTISPPDETVIPNQIDIDKLSDEEWQSLSPEQIKLLIQTKEKQKKTKLHKSLSEKKYKKNQEFEKTLSIFKESNPEFYLDIKERHKSRINRTSTEKQ